MGGNLVWVDLEMTGLDPATCTILEIASIVTDSELNPLGHFEAVIRPSDAALSAMSPQVRQLHESSGLLERARGSKTTLIEAEVGALKLASGHCPPGDAPLCGNSVHFDRAFLQKYMRKFHDFLHYRNLDVTTLKELAKRWYPELPPFRKAKRHTALSDIRESIEELRYYRSRIFVKMLPS